MSFELPCQTDGRQQTLNASTAADQVYRTARLLPVDSNDYQQNVVDVSYHTLIEQGECV